MERQPALAARARRSHRLILALAASVLAVLAISAQASAIAPPTLKASFTCSEATPCGAFTSIEAGPVAVDETTGNVYVVDKANGAIEVFTANGTYLTQILIPVRAEVAWGTEPDIAVDNSKPGTPGNLYVEAGEGINIPTNEKFGLYYAYEPEASNKFKLLWEQNDPVSPCGIAVDPSGHPWFADLSNGLQELNAVDGSSVGSPILKTGDSCHFAYDASGDIVLNHFGRESISKYDPAGASLLAEYDSSRIKDDVAVDTSTGYVYASTIKYRGTSFWNGSGVELTGSPLSGTGEGVAVNTAARELYASTPSGVNSYDLPMPHKLTVATAGPGTGSITCDGGGACEAEYGEGETVELEAHAGEGAAFAGWTVNGSSATCPGTGSCALKLTGDTTVEADFVLIEHELTVTKSGSGEVASAPAGISCGVTCSAKFVEKEFVVLTATPAEHNHLVGWTGCDAVNEVGQCEVTLGADRSVSAQFAPTMNKLSVTKAGAGSGSVSCQVGVGLQEPCAGEYQDGTVLTLTGTAGSGSSFAGFSGGGCSGTGPCLVTLNGDTAVTATFDLVPVEKAVEKVEKPVEKPVEVPTEKPAGKPTPKHLTRGQLLATAIKRCRKLPKHKRAACIKRAKKRYAPPKHKRKK